MAPPDEHSSLLSQPRPSAQDRRLSALAQHQHDRLETGSLLSHLSKEELALGGTAVGERLPYNDYATIDWLHDLVKDSYRLRSVHAPPAGPSLRTALVAALDSASGWIAAALIGIVTACVAFLVDVAVATVSDWKVGHCRTNVFWNRESCCADQGPSQRSLERFRTALSPWAFRGARDAPQSLMRVAAGGSGNGTAWASVLAGPDVAENCPAWKDWSSDYHVAFAVYVAWALLFGIVSGGVTMLTKRALPATAPGQGDRPSYNYNGKAHLHAQHHHSEHRQPPANRPNPSANPNDSSNPPDSSGGAPVVGKTMYMAAGSGIPEIKTILSGFVIPHFLDVKVLLVKAVGSIFAVSTGMCLGKEGPFVHISTCVAHLVGNLFPKYRDNGRKMREILSAGCASGLSVAFGAPIGGVLFSYEEISTYFPKKVLWRAFLCSLFAAMVLRALNPTGTGKLVLFETSYGTAYQPQHYLVFVFLGVAGGVFGGTFCKANFLWSRTFRKYAVIKNHPVLEVALVVLATAMLQYPNQITRETGDIVIKNLLVDCNGDDSKNAWVCVNEAKMQTEGGNATYIGWLVYGTLLKLVLTTITFGIKVPSGIIIPALDAGAFFGRMVGQAVTSISPGIFAMVGAGAFLAGVSRMTISLGVIMFELTGELEYIIPNMIAILVAKWVADALEPEGVYDLAQTVLGHPFLNGEHAMKIAQMSKEACLVEEVVPPKQTMNEITVDVPASGVVGRAMLWERLELLKRRGLMDAGLVLVRNGMLLGYLGEGELEFGLKEMVEEKEAELRESGREVRVERVRLSGEGDEDAELNLAPFVDRTPLTICKSAPIEYAVEMFSKLGLRYLCVVEEESGKLCGVVIKKRILDWLQNKENEK